MDFHICHVVPDPKQHGPLGYLEVIDTFKWGLAQLGHKVSYTANACDADKTNIIFGGHMLPEEAIRQIPRNSIFYNLEQMAGTTADQLRSSVPFIAANFRVWDYNRQNVDAWLGMKPAMTPLWVPIGWAPVLGRIGKRQSEEIEVLFYGLPGDPRLNVFQQLCAAGIKCVFACGLYGPSRDDLIGQSKVVLNINMYSTVRVFEVVRVSFLLANEKAVVADLHPQTLVDEDIRQAVAFAPLDEITATCVQLLENETARRELAARGKAIFQKRDIRKILGDALRASNVGG